LSVLFINARIDDENAQDDGQISPTRRELAMRARVLPLTQLEKEFLEIAAQHAPVLSVHQLEPVSLAVGPHVETSPEPIEVWTPVYFRLQKLSRKAFSRGVPETQCTETMDHQKSHSQDPGGGGRLVVAGRCNCGRQETEHAQLARRERLRQPDHRVPTSASPSATARLTFDSGRDELDDLLTYKRVGVYCGVDPTAPSLHVGHMVPFMVLGWMYIHGYHSTFLVRHVLLLFRFNLTKTSARWLYGTCRRSD
jgi:hypothetical protein